MRKPDRYQPSYYAMALADLKHQIKTTGCIKAFTWAADGFDNYQDPMDEFFLSSNLVPPRFWWN